MKNLIKKIIIFCLIIISAMSFFGCEDSGIDKTKTQLYVSIYGGGVGYQWLYRYRDKFEELNKDVSFEPGKKGVQLIMDTSKGDKLKAIASSQYNVIFTGGVKYNDLAAQNLVLDITDIITEVNTDGKTIESKLPEIQKQALTVFGGKYYALPHYEFYPGITYDVDLFDKKALFFDRDGNWTNLSGDLSCGPDGEYGTYDDGLPSSHEEFFDLCDQMLRVNVTPFIITGQYVSYADFIPESILPVYCGADEFMLNFTFDSTKKGTLSGDDLITTEIITGWDGDIPIIERKVITPETGYLTYQQAGKYYALKFLERIFSNPAYISDKRTSTLSHLDAQEEFIMSSLENKPIAMLIDGTYWYNEAHDSGAFDRSLFYGEKAKNRRFAFMPLPSQITGTVTEGNGKPMVLVDDALGYAVINANIKNNSNLVALAKKFLKFCYTDENLQDFTVTTGVFIGVNYDLTQAQYDSLDYFCKSVYDLKFGSDLVTPISDSKIFVYDQSSFTYYHEGYFPATLNQRHFSNPAAAFTSTIPYTAKEYFSAMKVTESVWNQRYSRYFN
jgi:ABC-type glycerol-3-phosphate transport system substrate-binding protein